MQRVFSPLETLRWELCCIIIMLIHFLLRSSRNCVVEGLLYITADNLITSPFRLLELLLDIRQLIHKPSRTHRSFPVRTSKPDSALVFDTLLAKSVAVRDNPSHISSLFLHFAALISIDASYGLNEINQNGTRCLRLFPLYGKIPAEEASVRKFTDGLLKDDVFASSESALLPNDVPILLVMFNRIHNYVATGLLAINESNRFSEPMTPVQRDERIYQMARRITCRLYINIILNDYLKTLLGQNRGDAMQPNTLRQGLQSRIRRWFGGGPEEAPEFARALIVENWWKNALSEEETDNHSSKHTQSTNQGLSRSLDSNPFSRDEDMVKNLESAVQDMASTLSPNRVPVKFRDLQIRTIMEAQEQHTPTLNEFRLSLGLSAHHNFEDIHSSPLIVAKVKALYAHPDDVELYPGIVAEEPQSGFIYTTAVAVKRGWAGSTVTHAVLHDTVALIKRDPFYSDEGWNSSTVTNWGLHEPASDKCVSNGCVMHKLFLRAFPEHFASNSVYAHFPFVTPKGNRAILAGLGTDVDYSFEAPSGKGANTSWPSLTATTGSVDLHGWSGVFSKPLDSTNITIRYAKHSLPDRGKKASTPERKEIDLVEEAIAPYFAELFCSRFSLTLSSTQSDSLTTAQLWQAMKSIMEPACNLDPVSFLKLERNAKAAVEQIRRDIIKARKFRTKRSWREIILSKWQDSQDVDHSMCPAIRLDAHQLVTIQQVLVESIEYFLTDGRNHLADIQNLSTVMDAHHPIPAKKAADRLLHYLLEGYRLYLAAEGRSFWRRPASQGCRFANVSSAARNPDLFPHAATLDLGRNLDAYVAVGVEGWLLELLSAQTILKVFLELANYSGSKVVSDDRGAPRRINIPKHLWGITDTDDVRDGLGHASLGEVDWDFVGGSQDIEDDSWTIVSKGRYGKDIEDMTETCVKVSPSEATVYVVGDGGQLSNMPNSLKVAWNYGTRN